MPDYLLYLYSLIFSVYNCNTNTLYADSKPAGCIVIKYVSTSLHAPFQTMALPNDSIFYWGNHAIEKVDGFFDSEINGSFERSIKTKRVYFLDFAKNRRIEINHSLSFSPGNRWISLDSFKTGVVFQYKYYNGETFIEKDTIVENTKMHLIRYISTKGNDKGSAISVLFLNRLDRPAFFKNLETKFQMAVRRIEIAGNSQEGAFKTILDFENEILPPKSKEARQIVALSKKQ